MNNKKNIIIAILITIIIIIVLLVLVVNKKENNDYISNLYFENISTKKEVGKTINIEETNKNIYKEIKYPEIGNKKIDNEIKKELNNIIDSTEKDYLKDTNIINYYYFIDYETYIGSNNLLSVVLLEKLESTDLKLIKDNYYTYIYDLKEEKKLNNDDLFKEGYIEEFEELTKLSLGNDFNYIINDNKVIINKVLEINVDDVKDYLKYEIKEDKYYGKQEEKNITILNVEKKTTEEIVVYKNSTIDSEIIDTLKKDETVKVYAEDDKGFSTILHNNKLGYVDSKKLKKIETKKDNITLTNKKTLYIISDANIREEASSKSKILGELKAGTKVTKVGETSNWIMIEYKDGTGFVSTSLVSSKKIEDRKVKPNVPPQKTINPSKPMVALTFDDGPSGSVTPRILNTLEKYNVHATFFDVGNLMKKNPSIVKREAKIGEVGIHTYSHKNLNTLSEEELTKELTKSKETYKSILGYYPKLIRPPYGSINKKVKSAITDMSIINWNVDSLDWKYRNKNLTLYEIDKYGNLDGKIILMHSIHAPTAEAVEVLVPDLLDRGYQIVTVTELAAYKGYTLKPGSIYSSFK